MIRDIDNAALGQEGSIFITDIDAISIPAGFVAVAMTFYEDTQFKALTVATGFQHTQNTASTKKASDDISQSNCFTFPQGMTRLGRWVGTITLWKGVVEVYLAKVKY